MVGCKVQGERPEGWVVLEDGHGRIVGEVGLVEHLELLVATTLEEGRPHASDVFQVDATVQVEYLALAIDLFVPLAFAEPLAEAVTGVDN